MCIRDSSVEAELECILALNQIHYLYRRLMTSTRAHLQVCIIAGHHPCALRPHAEVDAVLEDVESLGPPPHLLRADPFVRPVSQRVINLHQQVDMALGAVRSEVSAVQSLRLQKSMWYDSSNVAPVA